MAKKKTGKIIVAECLLDHKIRRTREDNPFVLEDGHFVHTTVFNKLVWTGIKPTTAERRFYDLRQDCQDEMRLGYDPVESVIRDGERFWKMSQIFIDYLNLILVKYNTEVLS